MCGICGFVGSGDDADLEAMMSALKKRGPDDAGQWIDSARRLYLGHRRLAVIDIDGGHQPMFDRDRRICVVFNGAIYNHRELRRELEAKGYRFLTDHSDTEVLIHGYDEWGTELPQHLNGMFAFAICDRKENVLFLARDRFGEKPLYYVHGKQGFVFASDLRSLRCHHAVRSSVDRAALKKLFAYGFLPAPSTLYSGICKLPAGRFLTYHVGENKLKENAYWRFSIEPEEPRQSDAELAEELRELLLHAVRSRLIGDVPVGIFLSGGMDSSAILAMAAQLGRPEEIKTFCIGFQEASYDESGSAQLVADFFGSSHQVEMLTLDSARSLTPKILAQLDDPIADPSIVATWMVSRFARQWITVALSGDGGDELFAGYDPFAVLRMAGWYHYLIPKSFHQGLRRLADHLPKSSANMSLDFKLRHALKGLSYREECWNPCWLGPLEPLEIAELFGERVEPEDVFSEAISAWHETSSCDPIDRTLEFYTRFYLQDNILAKVDRASMMHSLEVRAPFLDTDVVEFVRRLPSRYKIRGGTRKYLLKEALKPLLPAAVFARSKKGFGIPVAKWLRELAIPRTADNVPYINKAFLASRWQAHVTGEADHRRFLWCCYVLQCHLAQDVVCTA